MPRSRSSVCPGANRLVPRRAEDPLWGLACTVVYVERNITCPSAKWAYALEWLAQEDLVGPAPDVEAVGEALRVVGASSLDEVADRALFDDAVAEYEHQVREQRREDGRAAARESRRGQSLGFDPKHLYRKIASARASRASRSPRPRRTSSAVTRSAPGEEGSSGDDDPPAASAPLVQVVPWATGGGGVSEREAEAARRRLMTILWGTP